MSSDIPPEQPTIIYKKKRHLSYDMALEARLTELGVDLDHLRKDFFYLPWYAQRIYLEETFGVNYCVRCAMPIPADQAAPGRSGLCLTHEPTPKHEYSDAYSTYNQRRYRRARSRQAKADQARRDFMESRGAAWSFHNAPPDPKRSPIVTTAKPANIKSAMDIMDILHKAKK